MKINFTLSLLAVATAVSLPLTAQSALKSAPKAPAVGEILKVYDSTPSMKFAKPAKAASTKAPAGAAYVNFKGALISSDEWNSMSITEVPYGLYDFTLEDGMISYEQKWTGMSNDWMGGAVRNGIFYGIRNINMFGSLTGVATIAIDTNTWQTVHEEFAENPSFALLPSTMSYDFVTGDIYGVFYNEDLTGLNWVKYDTYTYKPEIICAFNGRFNVLAMATAADGNIYIVNEDGDLYTVNRANSRVSYVGNTGVPVVLYTQSMYWNAQTNSLIWAAVTSSGSALYSLDPATAEATLLCEFDCKEQICSMFPGGNDTPMAGTPDAPRDLKWNFTAPGASDGTISFTCPSAGTLSVWLDGDAVKDEVEVTAGENITVPFSGLSNTMHHVSAIVKNSTGYSPVAESFQYVGYDVPVAIKEVTFTETDGVANLTWEAPAEGVEKGYLSPEAMYYRIVRLPEEITVADHHTSTTFSETLPLGVKRYAYRVTPCNGDGKVGESTLSNAIIYGQSFEVPYVDDFQMDGAIDVYTLIDGDGDGQTWSINTYSTPRLLSSSVTYDQNVEVTDNWIITPKISLKPGNLYRITAHTRNTWAGNPDQMAFGICNGDNMTREGITVLKNIEVNTPSMTLLDFSHDFTVDTEGNYGIAIGMLTPRGQGGGLFISEFKVELVGDLGAPAAVTELTLTPDADHEPKATVAFTAPAKSISGENLSGALKANIYRDGALKGTLENVQPGAPASWEDTGVPAGTHTYTVKMANDKGEGADMSATAFIGVYSAPFSDALDNKEALSYYTYRTLGFEDNPLNSEMHFPSWGDPCLEVDHTNFTDEHHEFWVVSPLLKLDGETVYKVSFDQKTMVWGEGLDLNVVLGNSTQTDDLTETGFHAGFPTGYDFETTTGLIVLTDNGGFKHLAFHGIFPTQGYLYWYLKNLKVERYASAYAPNVVTDAFAQSELTSKVTFKAPLVDFAGRPLTSIDKIEVYRNGSAVPSHTFTNPTPGESLEWTDENAVDGKNSYFIVSTNSYGRGDAVTVDCFIGYDTPVAPDGISIKPAADNQTAQITWTAPQRGTNGGVLDAENMSFVLVKYDPNETDTEKQITVIKTGIKETSVVPEREATDEQEMIYYGIVTVTPQGVSAPALYYTVLGKPYDYPFEESFTLGEAASKNWIPSDNSNNGIYIIPTSTEALEYNGFAPVCQDNDGGVFFFLNGTYSEYVRAMAVLTPKVSLAGATDPVLSFWLYKGNQSGAYSVAPSINTMATTDEVNLVDLGTENWTETEPEWVHIMYPLEQFKNDGRPVIFQMTATAAAKDDPVIMDNFRVCERQNASVENLTADSHVSVIGLQGALLTRGALGKNVKVYLPNGQLVADFTGTDRAYTLQPNLYLVVIGNTTYKVAVR